MDINEGKGPKIQLTLMDDTVISFVNLLVITNVNFNVNFIIFFQFLFEFCYCEKKIANKIKKYDVIVLEKFTAPTDPKDKRIFLWITNLSVQCSNKKPIRENSKIFTFSSLPSSAAAIDKNILPGPSPTTNDEVALEMVIYEYNNILFYSKFIIIKIHR